MWHVGSQVQELKKLVIQNKDALIALRTNFDKPDVMKELSKRLAHVDSVLQVKLLRICLFEMSAELAFALLAQLPIVRISVA